MMSADLTSILLKILEISWINVLLSGDNALVIALACRGLPERERRWGIIIGAAAAVLLRLVFAFLIVGLLALPFVKLAGGVLLFWIALELLGQDTKREREIPPAASILGAVRVIALADAIMSLDNVMAIAAAAEGSGLLIVFGLVLSVPLVIFGSTLLLRLLTHFPFLVWAGAALIGVIAANLMIAEPVLAQWLAAQAPFLARFAAAIGAAFVLLAGGLLALWRRKP
jgi:YjbE family integral membrane protein